MMKIRMPSTTSLARIGAASLCLFAAPFISAAESGKGFAQLLVLTAGSTSDRGKVEVVTTAAAKRASMGDMRCDRAYARGGTLACLHAVPGRGLMLKLADKRGAVQHSMNFMNVLLASRVRVSNDGALVAFTGFSSGHSYSGTDYSTRTYLIDAAHRRLLGDVSAFKIIEAANLKLPGKRTNVWGVSFDPNSPNRFVATVGSGDQVFLAQGDIQARTLTLMRADMECPSFSPDGKRVAFKRRRPEGGWSPAVYDLASGREWVMKESRSIDDQIEWVDNETIAYELPRSAQSDAAEGDTDVVVRAANGSGPSTVLFLRAGSPSVFD